MSDASKVDKIKKRVDKNIQAIECDMKKLIELNQEYLELIDTLARDVERNSTNSGEYMEDSK